MGEGGERHGNLAHGGVRERVLWQSSKQSKGVRGTKKTWTADPTCMWELSSPTRDLNGTPLLWKHGVLATGLPEKSLR